MSSQKILQTLYLDFSAHMIVIRLKQADACCGFLQINFKSEQNHHNRSFGGDW